MGSCSGFFRLSCKFPKPVQQASVMARNVNRNEALYDLHTCSNPSVERLDCWKACDKNSLLPGCVDS